MRIAQLTYTALPPRGGQDAYVLDLKGTLEAEGHEVVILQARRGEGEAMEVSPLFGRWFPFWGAAAALPLKWGALKEFDLLICHYSPYLLPVAWHRRTVLLSHGITWDDRPLSPRSLAKKVLDLVAFRVAWAVVANDTNFLRAMGVRIRPGEGAFTEVAPRVYFVPNCVDVGLFKPADPDPEISSLGRVILVPRHLYRNRGIHLAVEAFSLLAGEKKDLTLVVVGGEGEPGYVRYVKSLVSRLGLEGRVFFLPPRPRGKMPAVYSAALLTLVPSLAGEGTSLSALESMACGTPVVATSVGGLLDLPCLHAPPSPKGLARAIERALGERESLARKQREAVLSSFTIERWREAWLQIVKSV